MSLEELKERTQFVEAVCDVIRMIPFGRATSYSLIAKAIGYPTRQRMVGRVLAEIDSDVNLPAHRVVNNQGILSGRDAFGHSGEMQKRLEREGIVVINNKIKDWKRICWDPIKEIDEV